MLSLARNCFLTTGTRRCWPYFAKWHYRSHNLGIVRFVTLLWEGREEGRGLRVQGPATDEQQDTGELSLSFPGGRVDSAAFDYIAPLMEDATSPSLDRGPSALDAPPPRHPLPSQPDTSPSGSRLLALDSRPIGICVYTSPPLSLRPRNRFFGLSGRWSRARFQALNAQLVMLSRVVLHPTFRGCGMAGPFVKASCRACRWPWIETLTQMGHVNPFFEKAGFTRAGQVAHTGGDRRQHSAIYGSGKSRGKRLVSEETNAKSRYARPVYYVFDNRG